MRDIGTSLKNLKALAVSRCNLSELSGLMCFPKLQELYASFNNIKDLRPISDSYCLEVLDIEGNEVSDISQLRNFDFSHKLQSLNIVNNKIDSPST